jgi:hypothetical protein
LAIQFGLGICIDRFWAAKRDPDFHELQGIVRARQAEAPGRPLVLFLGSSRTKQALRAELLNEPGDPSAPIVVNSAISGGGPMMHQVLIRRWLVAGIRPDLIYLEIMPMSLSARQGAPIEEFQQTWRYDAEEVTHLWKYYTEPTRLVGHWALARAFPCYHNQAELRDTLALDIPLTGKKINAIGRDHYGWEASPAVTPPRDAERQSRESVEHYAFALNQPELAPGAVRALRDVLKLCADEGIPAVLVLPPEGSCFRSFAPDVEDRQIKEIHELAAEWSVAVIDARAWVDDDGFADGHHTTVEGADKFTRRFAREVLPSLRTDSHATGNGQRLSLR